MERPSPNATAHDAKQQTENPRHGRNRRRCYRVSCFRPCSLDQRRHYPSRRGFEALSSGNDHEKPRSSKVILAHPDWSNYPLSSRCNGATDAFTISTARGYSFRSDARVLHAKGLPTAGSSSLRQRRYPSPDAGGSEHPDFTQTNRSKDGRRLLRLFMRRAATWSRNFGIQDARRTLR